MRSFKQVKKKVLNDFIYMDSAATSFPKPDYVIEEVIKSMQYSGNPGRSSHGFSKYGSEEMYKCREEASGLFGVPEENAVLVNNCTLALNMAIKGYFGHENEKIVISNLEHNAVCRPLYALRDAGKITLEVFDALNGDVLQNFVSACSGASGAVITHASNVCGLKLPIEEMTEYTRNNGIFTVIDASQTAGYVPIDMRSLKADVVCMAGHKGLEGPMGTGLMLISPDVSRKIETIIEGGAGVNSFDEGMPEFLPERLEAGTPGVELFSGLRAALKNVNVGYDKAIRRYLIDGLRNIRNVTVYGGDNDDGLPVVLFNIEGMDCEDVGRELWEYGVCVRSGFHCAPLAHNALNTQKGGVRISPGKNIRRREVDEALMAIMRVSRK